MREYRARILALGVLAAVSLAALTANAQRGALTASRSLDQLADEAEVIVHGTVSSARVEPHPQLKNLMTVVINMQVAETLKGSPRRTLQFRQYIWDARDRLDSARYLKGQELLLMLGPVSRYGFTSPVGLEQGRFRITRQNGQVMAENGRGNAGLFEATEARVHAGGRKMSARATQIIRQARPGPMPLADLEDAIRAFGGPQ
jgi:hypothetical protein